MNSAEEIELFFRKNWIPVQPGLYDHTNFLAMERQNPQILELYADYIDTKRFDTTYLDKAEQTILASAKFLHQKLTEYDMQGQCVNGSMVLSRFLERQGVWNYAVKGALTFEFDPTTGLGAKYTPPIMMPGNPAVVGHMWVCAPPFKVVDITASLQCLNPDQQRHINCFIAEKVPTPASVDVPDLMDSDAIAQFLSENGRIPTLDDVFTIRKGLADRLSRFGVFAVDLGTLRLKYAACAVSASEANLEGIKNFDIEGKNPKQLYSQFQREAAAARRASNKP